MIHFSLGESEAPTRHRGEDAFHGARITPNSMRTESLEDPCGNVHQVLTRLSGEYEQICVADTDLGSITTQRVDELVDVCPKGACRVIREMKQQTLVKRQRKRNPHRRYREVKDTDRIRGQIYGDERRFDSGW